MKTQQEVMDALYSAREALDIAIAAVNFAVTGWVPRSNPQKIDRELRDSYNIVDAAIKKAEADT